MKRWKKVLLIVGCVLLSLVLITVGTLAILMMKGNGELYTDDIKIVAPEEVPAQVQDDGMYITYKGQLYKYNENITSMLFMGVDKRDIDLTDVNGLGGQADVIVMLAVDFKRGTTKLSAGPRDVVTDVAV